MYIWILISWSSTVEIFDFVNREIGCLLSVWVELQYYVIQVARKWVCIRPLWVFRFVSILSETLCIDSLFYFKVFLVSMLEDADILNLRTSYKVVTLYWYKFSISFCSWTKNPSANWSIVIPDVAALVFMLLIKAVIFELASFGEIKVSKFSIGMPISDKLLWLKTE